MFAMNPMHESEASKIRKDLEAAKLREAELASALEIARGWLSSTENDVEISQMNPVGRLSVAINRVNKALNAMLDPSATLAERDRAQQLKGWQDCLDSVRGSLRGYPDSGGDVEIMREVERIVVDALSHRLVDDDIEESGYLDTPLYPISEKQEPST